MTFALWATAQCPLLTFAWSLRFGQELNQLFQITGSLG